MSGTSSETRPFNGGGSLDTTEAPNVYGSNLDKLTLIPFIAVVAFLGYYGSQGVSEFNIYSYGEAKAQALCSPLANLQHQCKSKLKQDIAKASDAVKGKAVVEFHKGTAAVTTLEDTVSRACGELEKGVSKCHDIKNATQKFFKLPDLPTLPSVDAGEEVESVAKAFKTKTIEFTDAITSMCREGSEQLGSLCSSLDAKMDSVATQVDDVLSKLASDAPKRIQETLLKALKESSAAVCPALDGVPQACTSLKNSLQDALGKAEDAAEDELPKQVPKELLEAALKKAKGIALGYVDHLCKEPANVAKDCPGFFGNKTWQPLLAKIHDPLVSLQKQLKSATSMIKDKIGARCRAASHGMERTCKNVSSIVDAAVAHGSKASKDAAKASKATLAKLRESLVTKLTSLRSTFGDSLGKVGQSLDVLVGGCQSVDDIVKSQCRAVKAAGGQFSTSAKQVEGSLQHISDAGDQVEANCDKLGELQQTCLAVANPFAVIAKGATGLWQHRAAEIVRLEAYLLIGCSITVVIMMAIIKWHTMWVVTISIFLNLSAVSATAAFNLMIWNLPGAIMFGVLFFLKICFFCCMWESLKFAVKLIHSAVQAVEKFMGIGAWLLGLLLIAIQIGFVVLTGGAWYKLLGANPPPEVQQLVVAAPGLLPVLLVFAMAWTIEVTANVFHVTICCCVGSNCGVNTPAKSICGACCFAVTGALGSICSGSFMIALLKALQYALEKGEKSSNPCVKMIVTAACCLLQWLLKLFSSYAFVFVGLKGMSYCSAAEKTVEAFGKDGVAAMAADVALHDVVGVAKMVSVWVSVLLSVYYGRALGIIGLTATWQEIIAGPILCIAMAGGTSYALTLVMGRLLEAAVCTLFIIFEDENYSKCMLQTQSEIYHELKDKVQKDAAE